ncbi:amidase family protein [Streptomyces sp. NPDC048290]|uniref:amidase family protein n=1 Tax=Streptomyces sp. NPDC048290 TaxID=3155811 RepID=UPI003448A309
MDAMNALAGGGPVRDVEPSPCAHAIAAAVRSGVTRAVDTVTAALDRIERTDPALGAFSEVWEEAALRRAAEVDARVAAGGAGPLAGVPFAVKGRRGGLRAADARALVDAGCVPVGATSVPGPGTAWQTWGRGRHGRTVNPWRADRTPGGSSAGAAAAVAAGLVPLATGADGAGSIRLPAAWCGVLGLKITNGRLPVADRTGLTAPGVLARCAGDAALYWSVVSGGGAVVSGWGAVTPGCGSVTPGCGAVVSGCGAVTPGCGSEVSGSAALPLPVSPVPSLPVLPPLPPLPPASPTPPLPPFTAVWSPDLGFATPDAEPVALALAAVHRLTDAGVLRPATPDTGTTSLAAPVARTTRTASAPPPAPLRLTDPAPAWLALRAPGTTPASDSGTDPAPVHPLRAANDRRLAALFADAELLLTPAAPTGPHGHDGPGDRYSTELTWAFNLSGHPAISLPAGWDSDGCPAGLQVVAPHGREDLLLAVAVAAEAALDRVPCICT